MLDPYDLLASLADGRFHSGQNLADRYGVSRMAVSKALKRLVDLGLEIDALRGRGYRLSRPLELLDAQRIHADLPLLARKRVASIEILPRIDSTNKYLMQRARERAKSGSVCLAEMQTKGRGRRGRRWVSPFGANLYLSVLWRLEEAGHEVSSLSLAVAVAVAKSLTAIGLRGHGIKWPNDLYWQGRKLGGVLLEMFGEAGGPCDLVIGVGLNVRMPEQFAETIEQPWVDLSTALGSNTVSRNQLATAVIEHIFDSAELFRQHGFSAFNEDWQCFDLAAGRSVVLHRGSEHVIGRAVGVDRMGCLLLESQGDVRAFASGEVSLRFSP